MVITSALPGEGKSTVALNLALSLAEVSDRVLLVDADMRRPTVAGRLGIEGAAGLSTVLVGQAAFDDVAQDWGRLTVLTAGVVPPNPAELLSSPAMAELAAELAARFDVVIWDTAPLLPVTDAQLLARHADGVVLVAGTRTVRRAQLAAALDSLQRVETRLLGVVLNMLSVRSQVVDRGYGAYELPASADPRQSRVRVLTAVRARRRTDVTPHVPAAQGVADTADDGPAPAPARVTAPAGLTPRRPSVTRDPVSVAAATRTSPASGGGEDTGDDAGERAS
jgi:succinoglycan biosynthesis transport protein ExoP